MRTPPTDLSESRLRAAVATQWSITAEALTYAPVGFGSHHWVLADQAGRRYFVAADAVADTTQRLAHLSVALGTAYALRHQCGLSFVVASRPGHDGRLLAITGRYAISLYPYLERAGDAPASPQQLLAMVSELHANTSALRHQVAIDDLSIPHRAIVEDILDGVRALAAVTRHMRPGSPPCCTPIEPCYVRRSTGTTASPRQSPPEAKPGSSRTENPRPTTL